MSIAIKQQLTSIFSPVGESLLSVVQLVPNESKGGREKRDESKYLCLTAKRNGKNRLHKVKYSGGSYNVTKSWLLTELEVVEVLDRYTFATTFGNAHQWQVIDGNAKDEFITTMLKLTKKKPPRLVNVDARLMKASNYDLFAEAQSESVDPAGGPPAAAPRSAPAPAAPVVDLVNIDDLLKDLNWRSSNSAAAVERKLQQDLTQLESDNIHALIESTQRTQLIGAQIDKAVQQLDVMAAWIATYSSTLQAIAPQVQYIQDQNRAAQTQARNQGRLKATLEAFLSSLGVPPDLEDLLRHEPLDQTTVAAVEHAAQALLAAQHTQLDPDLQYMSVVREQTAHLRGLTFDFAQRLASHVLSSLAAECEATRGDRGRLARCRALLRPGDTTDRELAIAPYRGLALWLKQAEPKQYQELVGGYVGCIGPLVRAEIKEMMDAIRSTLRDAASGAAGGGPATPGGGGGGVGDVDSSTPDYLFTAPLSMAATVAGTVSAGLSKAGSKATLATIGRKEKGGKGSSSGNPATDTPKQDFGSAFSVALINLVPAIQREQHFVVGFFHLYPNPPAFDARSPKPNPKRWRDALPAYPIANGAIDLVKDIVGAEYEGLAADLGTLVDMGVVRDGGAALVMLNVVEKQMAFVRSAIPTRGGGDDSPGGSSASAANSGPGSDPANTFLFGVLLGLQARLRTAWLKVLDQQARAIQESKLAKKKQGVLPFVRTCPRFIEHMCDAVEAPLDGARIMLESALEQILKIVVQSIEVLPVVDDEVLILENTLFLFAELRSGPAPAIAALEEPLQRLTAMRSKHLEDFIAYLMRKGLGKFYEFIVGLETLLGSQTPEEVAYHQAYSKAAAKKAVASMPPKEMIKAIEYMHKKIGKTLSDPGVVEQVWATTQYELQRMHDRAMHVLVEVYRGDVEVEFSANEVRTACASL